jgi:hypothetical protein
MVIIQPPDFRCERAVFSMIPTAVARIDGVIEWAPTPPHQNPDVVIIENSREKVVCDHDMLTIRSVEFRGLPLTCDRRQHQEQQKNRGDKDKERTHS